MEDKTWDLSRHMPRPSRPVSLSLAMVTNILILVTSAQRNPIPKLQSRLEGRFEGIEIQFERYQTSDHYELSPDLASGSYLAASTHLQVDPSIGTPRADVVEAPRLDIPKAAETTAESPGSPALVPVPSSLPRHLPHTTIVPSPVPRARITPRVRATPRAGTPRAQTIGTPRSMTMGAAPERERGMAFEDLREVLGREASKLSVTPLTPKVKRLLDLN